MSLNKSFATLLERIAALELENADLRKRLAAERNSQDGSTACLQTQPHLAPPAHQPRPQAELENAYARLLTESIELRRQAYHTSTIDNTTASPPQAQTPNTQHRTDQLAKAYAALHQSLIRLSASNKDLNSFLSYILINITQHVEASSGHIFLFDAQANTLKLQVSVQHGQVYTGTQPDEPELFQAPFPANITPAFQYLCEHRAILSLNDETFSGMAWPGIVEWCRRDRITEALCLALTTEECPVGLLGLRFTTKTKIQPEEKELIYALAHLATLAIELTRLSDEATQAAMLKEQEKAAQDRAAELAKANESLKHSLNRLATDSNLDSFLTSILQEALRIIKGKQAQIFFYDAATETLTPSIGISGHGEEIIPAPGVVANVPEINHPFPANITGGWQRLVKNRFPIYFDIERDTDDFWPGTIEWHRSHGNQGVICIALMLDDQPLGMLGITMPRLTEPTDAEYEFFQALAQHATLALHLTRLADEAQQAAISKEREKAAEERVVDLTKANDFLQSSLQKLAEEPELEKFLGHMLTVCSEQFGASEAGIWRNEDGIFRLFVSYENQSICLQDDISHPGANLAIAQNIRNQNILAQLRKGELVIDYEEDFETGECYEQFRNYFKQRGIKSAIKIPMFLDDVLRGILVLRFCDRHTFRPEEAELAHALANQAVLALELTRLADVAQKAAIVEERNRMARDIHDNLAQTFTSILMRLQTAALTLSEENHDTQLSINRACDLAREGLANARRSVHALRPQVLENQSLPRALASCLQQMTTDTQIHSKFQTRGNSYPLPPSIESELFHIGQEAITNACKHAQAQAIHVDLTFFPHQVKLSVRDNGTGFSLTPSSTENGFGLISMQERAQRIGSMVTITSQLGQGTEVVVVVPLHSAYPKR